MVVNILYVFVASLLSCGDCGKNWWFGGLCFETGFIKIVKVATLPVSSNFRSSRMWPYGQGSWNHHMSQPQQTCSMYGRNLAGASSACSSDCIGGPGCYQQGTYYHTPPRYRCNVSSWVAPPNQPQYQFVVDTPPRLVAWIWH